MKTLICDDHQLILDGLRNLLSQRNDLEIVAEATNGEQALQFTGTFLPGLLLMDVDMPIMNGLDATEQIKRKFPETRIIILTMHEEPALVKRIMEIGADGFLIKSSDQEIILKAIDEVLSGKKYFPDDLLNSREENNKLALEFSIKPSDALLLAQLTERELEILKLIAEGLSNKEIGDRLFISHRTVDTHRTNLMKKLDVHNIAGLIRFALKNRLTV